MTRRVPSRWKSVRQIYMLLARERAAATRLTIMDIRIAANLIYDAENKSWGWVGGQIESGQLSYEVGRALRCNPGQKRKLLRRLHDKYK